MERCHARRAWPPVSGLPFAITPSKQMILVGVCETCAAKDDATLLREGFTELRRAFPQMPDFKMQVVQEWSSVVN